MTSGKLKKSSSFGVFKPKIILQSYKICTSVYDQSAFKQ